MVIIGRYLLLESNDYWMDKLELIFSLKQGRSILTRQNRFGPILVQKSFYPEDDKIIPHVYLLYPPGGLVGGDQVQLSVYLESGSQALLTTPGSTKFYRTNGKYIVKKYMFKLSSNTSLEWLPQSSIFYPNTKVQIDTVFYLEPGARIIASEMLCLGSDGSK